MNEANNCFTKVNPDVEFVAINKLSAVKELQSVYREQESLNFGIIEQKNKIGSLAYEKEQL